MLCSCAIFRSPSVNKLNIIVTCEYLVCHIRLSLNLPKIACFVKLTFSPPFSYAHINIFFFSIIYESEPGSSGSIVSDYELDDRAIGVRSTAGAKDSSSNL
jgi:hypothetical protein